MSSLKAVEEEETNRKKTIAEKIHGSSKEKYGVEGNKYYRKWNYCDYYGKYHLHSFKSKDFPVPGSMVKEEQEHIMKKNEAKEKFDEAMKESKEVQNKIMAIKDMSSAFNAKVYMHTLIGMPMKDVTEVIEKRQELIDFEPSMKNTKADIKKFFKKVEANSPEYIRFATMSGYKSINYQLPESGDTALHVATRKGCLEAVEALLKCNANPDLKNNLGYFPIHECWFFWNTDKYRTKEQRVAQELKTCQLLSTILSYGGFVGSVDQNGETALHVACRRGPVRAVLTVLGFQGNHVAANRFGETPSIIARNSGDFELVRLMAIWDGVRHAMIHVDFVVIWKSFIKDYLAIISEGKSADTIIFELDMAAAINKLERAVQKFIPIDDVLLKKSFAEMGNHVAAPLPWDKNWNKFVKLQKQIQEEEYMEQQRKLKEASDLIPTIAGIGNGFKGSAPLLSSSNDVDTASVLTVSTLGLDSTLGADTLDEKSVGSQGSNNELGLGASASPKAGEHSRIQEWDDENDLDEANEIANENKVVERLLTTASVVGGFDPEKLDLYAIQDSNPRGLPDRGKRKDTKPPIPDELKVATTFENNEISLGTSELFQSTGSKFLLRPTSKLQERHLAAAQSVINDAKFTLYTRRPSTASYLMLPIRSPVAPYEATTEEYNVGRLITSQGHEYDLVKKNKKVNMLHQKLNFKPKVPTNSIGCYTGTIQTGAASIRDQLYSKIAKESTLDSNMARKAGMHAVDSPQKEKIDLVNDKRVRYASVDILPPIHKESVVETLGRDFRASEEARQMKESGLGSEKAIEAAKAKLASGLGGKEDIDHSLSADALKDDPTLSLAERKRRDKTRRKEEAMKEYQKKLFLKKKVPDYGKDRLLSSHNMTGTMEYPYVAIDGRYTLREGDRTF